MQKKSTFFSLSMPQISVVAMVLLAIVMMFFINKYFEYRIKMLRQKSNENAALSTSCTTPDQDIPALAELMMINPIPV